MKSRLWGVSFISSAKGVEDGFMSKMRFWADIDFWVLSVECVASI